MFNFATVVVGLFVFVFNCEHAFSSKYVNITDFPYHASVRRFERHVCSGALVHEYWIITAATCVHDSNVLELSVTLGSSDRRIQTDEYYFSSRLNDDRSDGQILRIDKIVVHPSYEPSLLVNNIALTKTKTAAKLGDSNVLPILLPSSEQYNLKEGSLLVISGWKKIASTGNPTTTTSFEPWLSASSLPLVNQRACASTGAISSEKILCAGYYALYGINGETCQGDVGAPLAKADVLLGILSSYDGCDSKGRAATFARISNFLPWITRELSDM